jgi:carboxyl-terminal processing protease
LTDTKHLRIRFLLAFLAGILAAVLVATAASVGSFAATRYEELSLFTNVLTLVRRNYVEPVDERKLVLGAIQGMLTELDPHSSFMDAEAYKEMQVDTKGEFHGLGIEISKTRDGYIEVVSPIEGTPADRAGIKSRDQIVAICPTEVPEDWDEECRSTKAMTLFDAVNLMRGRKGTKITIEVFRQGFERPMPYAIVRDVVKVVSVSARMLEPGYAYLRIRAFQERTAIDLARALEELHEEAGGPFSGLVIDLRDNPGGLLNQAVQVADAWLSDGLVVYTKGRIDGQEQEFRADVPGTEPSYPITVIVNEGSASASEIVAGALQDHHRALVVGKKTFGKGSVQTVYPLEGGNGLRLTTALYYTPGGRSIQEVGIAPDIAVDAAAPAELAQEDSPHWRVRETDLEGHFTHEDAAPEPESESSEPQAAAEVDSDVQLTRAIEVLKSWTYFERLKKDEKPATVHALSTEAEPTAATP